MSDYNNFLDTAKNDYAFIQTVKNCGYNNCVAFMCKQCAEKYLKAVFECKNLWNGSYLQSCQDLYSLASVLEKFGLHTELTMSDYCYLSELTFVDGPGKYFRVIDDRDLSIALELLDKLVAECIRHIEQNV